MFSIAQNLLSNLGKLDYDTVKFPESKPNYTEKVISKTIEKSITNGDKLFNNKFDLNSVLIKNPDSTFLIKVVGNSMIKAGINSGDILVVDRNFKSKSGSIIVAALNDELLVKRFIKIENGVELVSENDDFPDISVKSSDKFEVWGVVKSIIKILEN